MIKKVIIGVLLLIVTSAIGQQSTSSPYSVFGLGLENFNGTIANKSMAGLSLYSDAVAANLQNPATYSDLKLTSFGVGTSYTNTEINSQEGTGTGKATTLDYLAISIPAEKFGFGFGFQPYRSVGYRVQAIGLDEAVGEFEQLLEGTGNVSRVYLGAGTKVAKGLKIGAEVQYNFGRLEEQRKKLTNTTFSSRLINQSDIFGVSYTFSGIYDYELEENFVIRSSIIYNTSGKIKSENNQERATISSLDGVDFTDDFGLVEDENIVDRTFRLPSTLTVGLSFAKTRKWFLGGEAYITNNNDYQDRAVDRAGVVYTDAFGVKGGGFYIPKFNSLTSYFNRITYRAGIYYDKLGLQINGTDINEFGISFGFGLPLPREFSTLDIGFELGSRGQVTERTIREDYFSVSLGLSLGQKWFKKRKYD